MYICSKYSKIHKFLSLLVNCFPFVRRFRVHRKIRYKRIKKMNLIKDKPKHLRGYLVASDKVRRL